MTAQEYIESGAIEACMMGMADDKDLQLHQAMEQMYPEVKAVREQLEIEMERRARQQGIAPSANANQRINQAMLREMEAYHAYATTSQAQTTIPLTNPQAVDRQAPKPIRWFRTALAASVLLLMGSVLINFYYFSKFADYRTRYNELMVQQNALLAKKQTMEGQLAAMKDPVMKPVRLVASGKDDAMATVYYNSSTSEVYLMLNRLPDPGAGKQYQLWAEVDGKMIDAGLVDINDSEAMHKMKSFAKATAFAISVEKEGGAIEPTLSSVKLLGKV